MPSPRSSSGVRPSSPLSTRFDAGPRHDSLQPPGPRIFNNRTSNTSHLRQQAASLMLPALPRFHPANFPSNNSSHANTPGSGPASPQPMSPFTQQKFYSDAQKQLFLYQRETMTANALASHNGQKPNSPRLAPLGSPGPVTPFELEAEADYLIAGSKGGHRYTLSEHSEQLSEKLVKAANQRTTSPRSTSSSSRAR